jgi:hypothetical protein
MLIASRAEHATVNGTTPANALLDARSRLLTWIA